MHGELMEFNERLQLQYNYWQAQALRLQEELIDLRGPVRTFILKYLNERMCFVCLIQCN